MEKITAEALMTLAQATAEYNEFISISEDPEEMDFDSWIEWESLEITG